MSKLMTRKERKLAARLLMNDLRKARQRGRWSDGNRLFDGEEIEELIGKLSRKLINDTADKRPRIPRFSNALAGLSLVRRNPAIHGLPEKAPALLAERARKTYGCALSGTPGSMDHFVFSRRLARRAGSVERTELLLDQERAAFTRRLSRPGTVIIRSACFEFTDGEPVPAGTRLTGTGHGSWFDAQGREAEISPENLVATQCKPVRMTKGERRRLAELTAEADHLSPW
ncbi:hypothetical protein AB9K35_08025 [Leisingera sp. XS_AS12]|uniref:hypothetical protein n=1 Tax=Leisingera sp. XS_AS12 TaxID=3241294 RepID=UPI0035164E5D